jgi:uncharacterized membrane protein
MFRFQFLLSAIILILLDSLYLKTMNPFFNNQIQHIQNSPLKINMVGILLCYIFIITGLNYFIIKDKRSASDAFLLGLVIYGIYEATNYSIFKNWSILMVIIDTLWGGILFGLTTFIVYKI